MAKEPKLPKQVIVWWSNDGDEDDYWLMAAKETADVATSLEHGESRKFGVYVLKEEKTLTRTITVEDKVK